MLTNARKAVGAYIISKDTKRALFNLRTPLKTYGLQWGIWGGMMEFDERPIDALKRELYEEIGFTPPIERIYPFDVYESKNKQFTYITYVCVVENEFIPNLNGEAVGFSWIDYWVWPKPLHEGVHKTFSSKRAKNKVDIIISQHSS